MMWKDCNYHTNNNCLECSGTCEVSYITKVTCLYAMEYSLDVSVFQHRLRTFTYWPRSDIIKGELLAQAGFYYAGQEDKVTCFSCKNTLHRWEPGDDPWVEHAKWFSVCTHLHKERGEEFIKRITGSTTITTSNESGQSNKETGSTTITTSNESGQSNKETGSTTITTSNESGQSNKETGSTTITTSNESGQSNKETGSTTITTNNESGQSNKETEEYLCKICMDNKINVVLLPCGHLVSCLQCASALNRCPICRVSLQSYVRTYLA
ncbi:UNVERIFIED_CONTAM: hypothetical protein FKN15_020077 [Acipenser sinensis]